MVINCTTRNPAIALAVSGTKAAGIRESLHLTVDQVTTAHIRQPWNKITDQSFAAPGGERTSSPSTNQEMFLSGLVKMELGHPPM